MLDRRSPWPRGSRFGFLWLCGPLAALALLDAVAAEAQLRLGSEFQVNVYTNDRQSAPALAADSDGDFVVVWASFLQDGSSDGVFARRFSRSGAPVGREFQVSIYSSGSQNTPVVASESDGDFVIGWRSGTINNALWARRFSSFGTPRAREFRLNDDGFAPPGTKGNPSIAATPSGAFVVAWDDRGDDHYYGSSRGILARRFTDAGNASGNQFHVNRYTAGTQDDPAVARRASGAFLITWTSDGQDGSGKGVFAQRFSILGTPVAGEFPVNRFTASHQQAPSVAASAVGDFLIAWSSLGQDGSGSGVFARRFSSLGVPLASEFQVNTLTEGAQASPSVAAAASGDFIVAWASNTGVFARRVLSAGTALATEFQVNSYTGGTVTSPAVAVGSQDDFVVVWEQSNGHDGSGAGIFAQRIAFQKVIDIDGDGTVAVVTDGMLIARFLFGFSGTSLISDVVNATGCTRCDAAAIEAYLAILDLDVDGNGIAAPLTDGVLMLRFIFGFSGATLTAGAVNTGGCTRCDAAAIEAYLEPLS